MTSIFAKSMSNRRDNCADDTSGMGRRVKPELSVAMLSAAASGKGDSGTGLVDESAATRLALSDSQRGVTSAIGVPTTAGCKNTVDKSI